MLKCVLFLLIIYTFYILDRSWRFSTRSLCSPLLIALLDHQFYVLRPLFPPISQQFSLFSFSLSLFLTCTTVIAAWQCATDICPNYTKLSFGRERWKLLVNYQPISIIKNFEKNLDFSHENWTIIIRWIFLRNENFSLIFIFLELWSIEGTSHCQSLPLTDYTKFTWQYNTLPSSASIGESLITELRNGKSL